MTISCNGHVSVIRVDAHNWQCLWCKHDVRQGQVIFKMGIEMIIYNYKFGRVYMSLVEFVMGQVSCPQEVKEAAYKGLVRPVLDYGSSVWDPPGVVLQEELESVQKRAARFVTGNYDYETGSMTGILGQLKWESLKKRRKDNRLILLYKGLKGKASVPTDDLIPKTRRCRNQHSMAFQTPIANTDVYKGSFFPQTIRDWNALPDSLISSAEDAEDCVAKFTSLVRARD